MKTLDVVAFILLVVGGLNWGLVGLFRFDLVAAIFGNMSALSRIVYMLVGLSAIYYAVAWKAVLSRWTGRQATSAASSDSSYMDRAA